MKNLKSTYKVLRTDVELDVKEISYLVLFISQEFCRNFPTYYIRDATFWVRIIFMEDHLKFWLFNSFE